MVDAIICIFSKLTRPSMLVLLPSCANVISFNSNGINGITGGCNLPTDILRHGMKRITNSVEWMKKKKKTFSLKFPIMRILISNYSRRQACSTRITTTHTNQLILYMTSSPVSSVIPARIYQSFKLIEKFSEL
jgi:hypothetical protein